MRADVIVQVETIWRELWKLWRNENVGRNPLSIVSPQTLKLEEQLVPLVVEILSNTNPDRDEELFAYAREVRLITVGNIVILRASINASNKCRVQCGFCPMRRSESSKLGYPTTRMTVQQIVESAHGAHFMGCRGLFIQTAEDSEIFPVVEEALREITNLHRDWADITLNLGALNCRERQYERLREAGATKYLMKHETSNPILHQRMRGEKLEHRVAHMLFARRVGFEVGSGVILGLPGQELEDLARDLIFLGRFGGEEMVSCSPFTSSNALSEVFQTPPGSWRQTKRFIALLRIFFPHARIPSTSNLDSQQIKILLPGTLSGQAEGLNAGANGITAQFTPKKINEEYEIYGTWEERHIVDLDVAFSVVREVGMKLDLVRSLAPIMAEVRS